MNIVICAEPALADYCATQFARRLPHASITVRLNSDASAPAVTAADYALVWMPPQEFFAEQSALKAVFVLGSGVDALLAMNIRHDLPIIRIEDGGAAGPMADYVLAAVLRAYRRFDVYAMQQREQRWQQQVMVSKRDFRIGVLGLGAIGGKIARALADFGFAVRGFARSRHAIEGVESFAGDTEFDHFLDGLDVLVSILPLTAENRGILNRTNLAKLTDRAHLINIGRGAHLVEADLLALLDSGKLGGATLDVFVDEPLPISHPFWKRSDIVVTPHASAVTEDEWIDQIAAKIVALERGETVTGTVDRARGY